MGTSKVFRTTGIFSIRKNAALFTSTEMCIRDRFCGNLVFSCFNESTTQGMTSLMGNAAIFSKVNVPKYLFLFSKNVQTLINFGLTLCVFFVFCILDGITFTWKFILLLYPISCLVLFNIGVGLILSALFVFFRDIQYLWGIFTQLLMYICLLYTSLVYNTHTPLSLIDLLGCCVRPMQLSEIEGMIKKAGFIAQKPFNTDREYYSFLKWFRTNPVSYTHLSIPRSFAAPVVLTLWESRIA